MTQRPPARSVEGPQDLVAMFGGIRGMLEASIPGVVFAVVYPLTGQNLAWTAAAALVAAVIVLIVGLLQHRPILMGISGFLGVALMAGIALWRHEARLFYWISLYKNATWAVLYLGSILVRWPLVGVLLGPMLGEGQRWRHDRRRMRAYMLASWLWFGMFALRFFVQHAFYVRGEVTRLGFVNLVLGIPLFALTCGLTWLVIRGTNPPKRHDAAAASADAPAAVDQVAADPPS